MSESSIKLEWFLDNAVLMWRQGEDVFCLARDIPDPSVTQTLEYFYQGVRPVIRCRTPPSASASPRTTTSTAPLDNVRKERAMEKPVRQQRAATARPGRAGAGDRTGEQPPVAGRGLGSLGYSRRADRRVVRPCAMRLDGVLHTRLTQSKDRFAAVASRIKLISGLDIAERRLPQDGRITERISGREMDIRVSTVPCAFGESLVLRLLAKERDDLVFRQPRHGARPPRDVSGLARHHQRHRPS